MKQKDDTKDNIQSESTDYAGVDVNIADKDKVTPELVKLETKILNNNPRNSDI